ncbi:TauD/TfdA dioxygenase family protein [Nocardia takedensis]
MAESSITVPGSDAHRLTVAPVTGFIGAEIGGLRLGRNPSDAEVAAVREALLRYKVVFLRDQDITYEHLAGFAARFGTLIPGHPIYQAPKDMPYVRDLDSRGDGTRANYWHTDLTFAAAPPAFAFLLNVTCPPVGGDTIWANTAAAYAHLPAELRDAADGLRIVHSNDSDYIEATYAHSPRARDEYLAKRVSAEHPAVRVHPETGERALLLGGFARSAVGHRPRAGRELIAVLEEYATQPEYTVRWRWREGDLVIWDNQATMHYAVRDYGDAHRRALRVTVAGEVTVGVDGRPGRSIERAGRGYDAS